MSSKAKVPLYHAWFLSCTQNSPKSSPKKPAAKKSDAGVSKPKAARTGKSAANAERFKKAETKTTKVALRGGSSKAKSEVEAINKNVSTIVRSELIFLARSCSQGR